MDNIFQRKIYSQILQWKQDNAGKSALLIEGARRIGKSTIVEAFAKREYKSIRLHRNRLVTKYQEKRKRSEWVSKEHSNPQRRDSD